MSRLKSKHQPSSLEPALSRCLGASSSSSDAVLASPALLKLNTLVKSHQHSHIYHTPSTRYLFSSPSSSGSFGDCGGERKGDLDDDALSSPLPAGDFGTSSPIRAGDLGTSSSLPGDLGVSSPLAAGDLGVSSPLTAGDLGDSGGLLIRSASGEPGMLGLLALKSSSDLEA